MTSSQPADPSRHLSVNALARPLVERLSRMPMRFACRDPPHRRRSRRSSMRASPRRQRRGGLLVARDLHGRPRPGARAPEMGSEGWPTWIEVHSAQPVLACLGSQYAGWSLAASKEETGGKKFFSLGSGPARALAVKEPLFDELGYRDHARCAGSWCMEVDRRRRR